MSLLDDAIGRRTQEHVVQPGMTCVSDHEKVGAARVGGADELICGMPSKNLVANGDVLGRSGTCRIGLNAPEVMVLESHLVLNLSNGRRVRGNVLFDGDRMDFPLCQRRHVERGLERTCCSVRSIQTHDDACEHVASEERVRRRSEEVPRPHPRAAPRRRMGPRCQRLVLRSEEPAGRIAVR